MKGIQISSAARVEIDQTHFVTLEKFVEVFLTSFSLKGFDDVCVYTLCVFRMCK